MREGTQKVIGTHSGKFHADEVLGCFLLKQMPDYSSAVIKRTRNPDELNQCDIVIDVGGVYDHSKKRYDHHQKGFDETLKSVTGIEEDIKLSSAGLVWAHYGKEIVKATVEQDLSEKDIHDIFCRMYEMFIKEVDAKDNGIEAADPPYRYRTWTDFSGRVSRLNANGLRFDSADEETQFKKAMELAKEEYFGILNEIVSYWLPSREIVNEALNNRFDVDASGRIMKIEKCGVSWPAHLKTLEEEKKIKNLILFVVFPDGNSGWRVQAVPKESGFALRQPVLPTCLALRDAELAAACGVHDAIFVHANGFIGGARSYEGALEMARKSIVDAEMKISDS
ncbi:MYG1 protein C27H6.8 isoform X2 [Ischnura elegans]|uniref:MYG1 protein C27H6.8 isoform X2 n=1 Tax=Ischnura elegans TaxID=197161 RepID=UPI001ED8B746|nr:MYG1 protein C27H6.8 isoform X2 [Ischnura elegans]